MRNTRDADSRGRTSFRGTSSGDPSHSRLRVVQRLTGSRATRRAEPGTEPPPAARGGCPKDLRPPHADRPNPDHGTRLARRSPYPGHHRASGAARFSGAPPETADNCLKSTEKLVLPQDRSRSASIGATEWRRGQSPANPSRTLVNEHKANIGWIPTHAHDSPLHTPDH